MAKFEVGAQVYWKWLGNRIDGRVEEIFTQAVERDIKGKKIKRNGSPEKPAYLVRSVAGNMALKLETEVFDLKALKAKYGDK